MNTDDFVDRVLVGAGDQTAARALMTAWNIALVGDWCARKDFYREIALTKPETVKLWVLMEPNVDDWLADLRANGVRLEEEPDEPNEIDDFMRLHPEAIDPLLDHWSDPLTADELEAAYRCLWGDPNAP